jgi:hypothetical protein
MATISNTPLLLTPDAQSGIVEFHSQAIQLSDKLWNLRYQFESADKAYMREMDNTTQQQRAVLSNAYGDPTKFQNITVPVVLPQVEGAVVYQSSVFLTGHPLFGVVASPEFQDEAMQMNSIIEDQQVRGGWVAELMMHFRNGAKYNLAALEVDWSRKVTAEFETDLAAANGVKAKNVIWEGNKIKNLDLYNTFWDTRVDPLDVPEKGEFAGYTELMSRVALKTFLNSLPHNTNVKEAFESGVGGTGNKYYTPSLNPNAFANDKTLGGGTMDWMAWVNAAKSEVKIEYKDMYEVSTMYARIIPSDFKIRVPSAGTPQVWKFIIVNHSVVVYAERQTNAHGLIPILFSQPNADGLGHQTKSLAENVKPFQAIASAMWNSVIAARRRAISDRGIYDPSKIDAKHINSEAPNAKIPVRPSAYGQPVNSAYYSIPFKDDQSGVLMQESQSIIQMANLVSGQNQVRQGQFVKGNKTRQEFDTVMGNANGRDQITAMLYESQLFTPLKEILKLNNLQYQGGTSIYNREEGRVVEIDPIKLRRAILAFKMSDGLLPTDKLINGDTFGQALQALSSSPQLGSEYNMGPAFSYLMKTQGVDLRPFEKSAEQKAYEQAVGAWQQTVIEALKVGASKEQLPDQPTPEQYGYKPTNQVSPQQEGAATTGAQ